VIKSDASKILAYKFPQYYRANLTFMRNTLVLSIQGFYHQQ